MIKKIVLSLVLIFSAAEADIFEKGNSAFGVALGSETTRGTNYMILGLNGDYFLMNGLSVGLGYHGWFGGDDLQNQFTLNSSYYLPLHKKFRPYIGAFGRQTVIENSEDRTSYGGRAGLAVAMTPKTFISLGWAYEEYTSCEEGIFEECSTSYPEIVFSLSF